MGSEMCIRDSPSNEKFQKVSEKMDSIDVLIGEKKYCDAENILARLLRK